MTSLSELKPVRDNLACACMMTFDVQAQPSVS